MSDRGNQSSLRMYQVDAFTDRLFSGNPAAVLELDHWLPDDLMLAIAQENNLAETAFVKARPDGEWDLRWFAPAHEVDFCGHATLATAHVLLTHKGEKAPLVFHSLEAKFAQIECFHKGIKHPNGVVFVDEVFQPIREQKPLGTINAIHESLHAEHPSAGAQIMPVEAGFSHSLGRKQSIAQ